MSILEEISENPRTSSFSSHHLLDRIRYLDEADQMLFTLIKQGTVSLRQISRLTGIHGGTLSRRVHRLANRLHDPVVASLIDHGKALRQEHRQLGIEHFLHGKSITQLAELHQMTRREVARILTFLRGWSRGITMRG
ncbi:MAG: hypothetical protein IT447_06500 [Phycisphaerales bacterium]|jgi:predicted HTH domain antitoxin|nr:hypothetical protein [Phycisphaerales bacterium]